ncbi:Thermonuclease precursor [Roseimaritima multifibrata]|uniref:Thermonuclease n=2 Tax=Roseimaritima multifibrata TaxID=1930274 RepID=A0A517MJ12_9BACT|nr:Thermonuclease precursor [Roseimaritima multifibrata]
MVSELPAIESNASSDAGSETPELDEILETVELAEALDAAKSMEALAVAEVAEDSDQQQSMFATATAPSAEALAESGLSLPKQGNRTWIDKAGIHSVIATLGNVNSTHVQLERADSGKNIALPIETLSERDQVYVAYAIAPRIDPEAEVVLGKVNRVMDGDTIQIDAIEGDSRTIRLVGIDAPESSQRFGTAAKVWLTQQVSGKTLRVEITEKDRYGRFLGNVYVVDDGDRWLNREIILAGLAWHYVDYSKDIRLAQAQQVARGENAGLWQDARKVAPWDFRNGERIETAIPVNAESIRTTDIQVYITQYGSKYHSDGCKYLAKSRQPIPLSRAKSAYEPCSICKPPR